MKTNRRGFLGLLVGLPAAIKAVVMSAPVPVVAAPMVIAQTSPATLTGFWAETSRMAMVRSDLYMEYRKKLMENPNYLKFGDV